MQIANGNGTPDQMERLMNIFQMGGTVNETLNSLGTLGYELVSVTLVVNADTTTSSMYYMKKKNVSGQK